MSTDYYTTVQREGCGHCNRPGLWTDRLFVGTSAIGWRFTFKAYDEPGLPKTLAEWRSFLSTRTIVDEYGRVTAGDDFWRLVDAKAGAPMASWREDESGRTVADGPADMCPWVCP